MHPDLRTRIHDLLVGRSCETYLTPEFALSLTAEVLQELNIELRNRPSMQAKNRRIATGHRQMADVVAMAADVVAIECEGGAK